jgi:O-antigen ligase
VKVNLILFSLGLILVMATQLRLPGYPFGVGEGLLVAWTALSWVEIVGRRNIRTPSHLRPFVYFFAFTFAMLLVSGLFQAARLGDLQERAVRDALAYLFLTGLIVTFGCLRPTPIYARRALQAVTLGVIIVAASLFLTGQVIAEGSVVAVERGRRFAALSDNPNQLAMALVPIPFLCLYFIRQATTIVGRITFACGLALVLWIGVKTVSDALWLAWLVGAALAGAVTIVTKLFGRMHPLGTVSVVAAIGILGFLLLIATPLGTLVYQDISSGDQGGWRPIVWRQAVAEVMEQPLLGPGPGGHDLGPSYHLMAEAHNSYLDLALATGLPGLGVFLWLLGSLALRRSLTRQPLLWSAIMAMLLFICFHYMLRHPLFWFYLVLISSLAYESQAVRPGIQRAPVLGETRLRPRQA